MSTKIQINSLEALERLIGNDNELEIEIRNSIVANFTKKYLKDLAKSDLMTDTAKAIQEEIKTEFFETLKEGYRTKTVFKDDLLSEFREKLRYTAQKELSAVVSELVNEYKVEATIKAKLDSTVDWITEQLGHIELEKRLEKLVDARLKEKLGLN